MGSTYELLGVDEVKRRIKKLDPALVSFLAAGLYQLGQRVANKSVELVPVDQSILKNSRYVNPPIGEKNPSVEIGYGTNYALAVHETHPTKSKYLSRPFDAMKKGFVDKLARRVASNLKKGISVIPLPSSGGIPTAPKTTGGQ